MGQLLWAKLAEGLNTMSSLTMERLKACVPQALWLLVGVIS